MASLARCPCEGPYTTTAPLIRSIVSTSALGCCCSYMPSETRPGWMAEARLCRSERGTGRRSRRGISDGIGMRSGFWGALTDSSFGFEHLSSGRRSIPRIVCMAVSHDFKFLVHLQWVGWSQRLILLWCGETFKTCHPLDSASHS